MVSWSKKKSRPVPYRSIEYVELVHKCCPEPVRMGTARMKKRHRNGGRRQVEKRRRKWGKNAIREV